MGGGGGAPDTRRTLCPPEVVPLPPRAPSVALSPISAHLPPQVSPATWIFYLLPALLLLCFENFKSVPGCEAP